MTTVMRVLDIRATLGEGPVWCPRDQVLYWVDILSQTVNRFDPETGANRVWRVPDLVGSMALREAGGALQVVADGITTSNGLGWSPDDTVFYHTDTKSHAIHAYDYNIKTGTLSNRRLFAEVPRDAGRPA